MYSEQLEQLIKSVIADGVVTEKERAVLHKKAEAEGVDVDEIDVYVDGLIAQMGPVDKPKATIDYTQICKCTTGRGNGFLTNASPYSAVVDAKTHLSSMLFYFVQITTVGDEDYARLKEGYYLVTHLCAKTGYMINCKSMYPAWKRCELQTDLGTIPLVPDERARYCIAAGYERLSFPKAPERGEYAASINSMCFAIDEETIKRICDAKIVTLKTDKFFVWWRDKKSMTISLIIMTSPRSKIPTGMC